jgi:hypothetical protein
VIRCQLCYYPGEEFCSDTVGCNFRARRRLGIPLSVCFEWRARDLDRLAEVERQRGKRLAELPPRVRSDDYVAYIASAGWQAFANEQKRLAHFRCEQCGLVTFEVAAHHIDYRRLGCERPNDVLVLCPACHLEQDELRRANTRPRVSITVAGGRRVVEWRSSG